MTYLWLAAKVFHGAKPAQEAFVTVIGLLRMLLEGNVGGVIKGLKQMATQQGLAGEKKRTLAKVIGYFERNRAHMKYDQYLQTGYPIGSGVIEGACRHVIKDRMERAGMLWTLEGASALLGRDSPPAPPKTLRFHQKKPQFPRKTLNLSNAVA